MPTPEGRVVAAVCVAVRAAGGEVRKCVWTGRIGAPDLFVMLNGRHGWVECKAPGEEPRGSQWREFFRMAAKGGCVVLIVDSVEAAMQVPRALSDAWLEGSGGVFTVSVMPSGEGHA